jgi:hypothetical protein
MANNFSAAQIVPLDLLAPEVIGSNLSAPVKLQVITGKQYLSAPSRVAVVAVPLDTLSAPTADVVSYITFPYISFTTFVGDIEVMPDIIQIADTSSINVSTLVLSDKAGTGDCVLVPPSGASYQLKGTRVGFENATDNYTIPQHKSGYVWTNTSVTGSITLTLPSGARIGTSAMFLRTGAQVTVAPPANGQIWHSESGYFRPAGQSVALTASGTRLALICDGSNGWYPTLEQGTIT